MADAGRQNGRYRLRMPKSCILHLRGDVNVLVPYVMILDSDELLEHMDMEKLIRLVNAHPCGVGRIQRRNVFTRRGQRQENREWINRIFAKDRFHYEGRIHEQVVATDGEEYETYETPVAVEHTGYDLPEGELKKKAENALFFENIYEEFGGSADFQFLMGLIYMNNARFEGRCRNSKRR